MRALKPIWKRLFARIPVACRRSVLELTETKRMSRPNLPWIDQQELRLARRMQLLRGKIASLRGARVGMRFGLGGDVKIVYPGCLEIGDNVTIEGHSYIACIATGGVRIGSNTSIDRCLWLNCGVRIDDCECGFFSIGHHSYIGCNAVIGAGGGITIGNHVLIGQCVNMHAENHVFADATRLIRDQGVSYRGIVIQDDVWIGSRTTILDGVTIGKGAVIGAGAVVTNSVPPCSIAAGVPAKVIRRRGEG